MFRQFFDNGNMFYPSAYHKVVPSHCYLLLVRMVLLARLMLVQMVLPRLVGARRVQYHMIVAAVDCRRVVEVVAAVVVAVGAVAGAVAGAVVAVVGAVVVVVSSKQGEYDLVLEVPCHWLLMVVCWRPLLWSALWMGCERTWRMSRFVFHCLRCVVVVVVVSSKQEEYGLGHAHEQPY